jgi:hypothetical protein
MRKALKLGQLLELVPSLLSDLSLKESPPVAGLTRVELEAKVID